LENKLDILLDLAKIVYVTSSYKEALQSQSTVILAELFNNKKPCNKLNPRPF